MYFDVLLTVHLSIFISVFNQLDAQNLFHNKFYFVPLHVSIISCLYMFRAHVLIIRRSKLHYTASGIITPIGGHPVHRLRESSPNTYRCDDTRGCVMQFWPPDDEHMCSKHVEAWDKLIVNQKLCASSWLITVATSCTVYFDVLLTVHLSIFISVFNQLNAQNFDLLMMSTCARNM